MKHEVNISRELVNKFERIVKNKFCITYGKRSESYPFGYLLYEYDGNSYMSIPDYTYLKEIIKL